MPATPLDQPASEQSQALFAALRDLHLRAGEPSTRTIAAACGRGVISHNTVHKVLVGPRLPRLEQLLTVVAQLCGDAQVFRELWIAARQAEGGRTPEEAPPPPERPQPPPRDTGRLRLADELFLLVHHPRHGRPLIGAELLGIGLVGAVLAELWLEGRLTVEEGRLTPREAQAEDLVADHFLRSMSSLSQEPHPEPWRWVTVFKGESARLVGQRLAADGLITRERGLSYLLRPEVRCPPTAAGIGRSPTVNLGRHLLDERTPPDVQTAMLAALVNLLDGYRTIPLGLRAADARRRLIRLSAGLGPEARVLTAAVDTAIVKIALLPRL
ncbi:GPP34 family phosphoprotein [Longispora sp. NPDC051575]|uniref:GOLPH3/VPS74 family protein n=1 Tax=Longispora sp. NPDC051575 TaxID=3154943 RepID=UPI00343F93DA